MLQVLGFLEVFFTLNWVRGRYIAIITLITLIRPL